MIQLVPQWAQHFEEFWEAVKNRNLWFIKLRYSALLLPILFFFFCKYVLTLSFSSVQTFAIFIITFSILVYNFIFQKSVKFIKTDIQKFNALHFSFLQMMCDLISLSLLIYFTGGIESPLLMLFIFHMIIGSLILPGKVVYTLAIQIIIFFAAFTFMEWHSLIPHYSIVGLYPKPLYKDFNFIVIYLIVFSIIIITSIYVANGIARQLYKLEQDLIESFDKLKQAETEKQRYIISVVHELKTPISALQSYLSLILGNYLGPINSKVEEKLKRIEIRSQEAIELINNVLHISKLRMLDELNFTDLNVKSLINNLLIKFKPSLEIKNINLIYDETDDGKNLIHGDMTLLELVFSNLISNSIKYVHNGGSLKINLAENETNLLIKISDNGIGIPKDELNKIFNDFFRASNIKNKGFEGTGLGLSIVKQIVDKHLGKIELISPSEIAEPFHPGTTAIISFPLHKN